MSNYNNFEEELLNNIRKVENGNVDFNGFMLFDRVKKIRASILKVGQKKNKDLGLGLTEEEDILTLGSGEFAISHSGGKDSCVMSVLTDIALPGNRIPRIHANTGMELSAINKFYHGLMEEDDRFYEIKPSVSVLKVLKTEGYPYKSKKHSHILERYQRTGEMLPSVTNYLGITGDYGSKNVCPKILRDQFTEDMNPNKGADYLKISDKCCLRMKEEPLNKWQHEHNRPWSMIGVRHEEGGRRERSQCFDEKRRKLQPLVPVTEDWENWFIKNYNVSICDCYNPPYSLYRTGCSGCPFAKDLETELVILGTYYPQDYRKAVLTFGPVYEDYRKRNFRLKDGYGQMSIFDYQTPALVRGE